MELMEEFTNGIVQQAVRNTDEALKFVIAGRDEKPNRWTLAKEASAGGVPPQVKPPGAGWGGPSTVSINNQTSPFGQPAPPSQPSNTGQAASGRSYTSSGQTSSFGQSSAFGVPSATGPTTAAFGQASAMGTASAFGQPSMVGQTTSAIGHPSTMGQATSAFGQPSTMGQATSAFGKPSAMGQTSSAFGQPSTMGQTASAFGQPSTSQPSITGQQPAFGRPAFGQASAPNQASPFGKPAPSASPFAAPTVSPSPSPFAGAAGAPTNPSPFAQPQASAFGQASAQGGSTGGFGQPAQITTNGGFGQASGAGLPHQAQRPKPSLFGQATQSTSSPALASPFNGAPTNGNTSTQPTNGSSAADSKLHNTKTNPVYDSRGELTQWKGMQVTKDKDGYPCYRGQDRNLHRIWFPNGKPTHNTWAEGPASAYEGDAGDLLKQAYEHLALKGSFKDGVMPEMPPLQKWIGWDV